MNTLLDSPELRDVPDAIGKTSEPEKTPPRQFIEFFLPTELRDYTPPHDMILVGDAHITRGSVFVIGGCPGVGKSRASVALAVAGATEQNWFGLNVNRRFKTLIIQNENGRMRLASEFGSLPCEDLNFFIRVRCYRSLRIIERSGSDDQEVCGVPRTF